MSTDHFFFSPNVLSLWKSQWRMEKSHRLSCAEATLYRSLEYAAYVRFSWESAVGLFCFSLGNAEGTHSEGISQRLRARCNRIPSNKKKGGEGLGRWFSEEVCLLILGGTWVCFPAPTWQLTKAILYLSFQGFGAFFCFVSMSIKTIGLWFSFW